jgi:hypothetical protein
VTQSIAAKSAAPVATSRRLARWLPLTVTDRQKRWPCASGATSARSAL